MLRGPCGQEEEPGVPEGVVDHQAPWSQKSPREASPMISLCEKTLSGGSIGSAKEFPMPTPERLTGRRSV